MNIPYTKAKHAEFKRIEGGGSSLELLSIYIDTPPDKTEYQVEDTFSLEGLKVIATYSDDYYKDVTDLVVSSIPEGYEFTEEDEGEETVTLTYSQSGVTKTASFGISVAAEITVSYTVILHSNKRSWTSGGFEQFHRINVKNIKTINLAGTYSGNKNTTASGSTTEYLYINALYSTAEYADSGTTVRNIASRTLNITSTAGTSLSVSNTIDIDEIFAQYEDRENCYIEIKKDDSSNANYTVGANITCNITMRGKNLTLLTRLYNAENNTHYSQFYFASADMVKKILIKSNVEKTYSDDLYRLRQYGSLKTGSYTNANIITYNTTGEKAESEWPILNDTFDMAKTLTLVHDASGSNVSQSTTGTTKYKITLA